MATIKWYNSVTGDWEYIGVGSSATGDLVGPSSATDNAIVRFDGTTGKVVQNSSVSITDSGKINFPNGYIDNFSTNYTEMNGTGQLALTAGTYVQIQSQSGTTLIDGDSVNLRPGISNDNATVNGTPIVTTTGSQTLTNKDLTSGTNTFPTFNQNTTGSAATLTTARTVRTNLASTSTASFNGSANITPGVTGTLLVGNGGTGATTLTSGNFLRGNGTGAITSTISFKDEDDMVSNLATAVPSQQSVKAYVDGKSSSSWVFNETPSGSVNGTNTVFTLTGTPSGLVLSKNGVVMKPGSGNDYTLSGTTITMATAPATGSVLLATYGTTNSTFINGSNSLVTDETPAGSVNSSNTAFTTAQSYIGGSLKVFVNGLKQKTGTHFTETTPTSGIFTMSDAPLTGDIITVEYQKVSSVSGNADTVDGIHANSTPTANQLLPLDSNAQIPSTLVKNNHAYRAYLGSDQASANGAKINANTKSYDPLSGYNTTLYRYVVQTGGAGIWAFAWNGYTITGTSILMSLYKNGTEVSRGSWNVGASGFIASSGADEIQLAVGDYIELYAAQVGGGTPTVVNGSQFTRVAGHLVTV